MAEKYRLFGSVILLKEIFSDGLGHVYRAAVIEEGAVDRTVWLRVLDGADLPRPALVEAAEQAGEINRLLKGSQLPSNPFIIVEDGVVAIGCDWEAGQPLNRTLGRAHDEAFPFQADNALLVAEKIAQALATAEGVEVAGVPLTHAFLHPGLVLLSNDGEVSVNGFGLGWALAKNQSADAGARPYLAPEVLSGDAPSARSDVYTIGAILYHLLTGSALPESPEDRKAAQSTAKLAWDDGPVPDDIRSVLDRCLADSLEGRFTSAAELRSELDNLVFGGAYSPTTFNLALSMDRLFRAEIDKDELALADEQNLDPALYIKPEAPDEEPKEEKETTGVTPAAVPPATAITEAGVPATKRLPLYAAAAAVVVVAAAVGFFWLGRAGGPSTPPPPPTPTAEEIAAQRQAQDERLRSLTQEMVQSMMAEREAEIRDELTARQTRIEELQRRLQRSETRAATSAAAAADEAATQRALIQEIQRAEEEQRAQETALENERQQALDRAAESLQNEDGAASAAAPAVGTTTGDDDGANATTQSSADDALTPVATPEPQPTSPSEAEAAAPVDSQPTVNPGDFVPPEEIDTRPVIIKSQPLEWPRSAARSMGRGVVVIQLTVNHRGEVEDTEILRVDHSGFGIPQAALDAAVGYRFKPGTKNGVPITTHAFVTWRYDFTGNN